MPKAQKSFQVACVQMRSGIDRSANIVEAQRLIEEAAAGGAKLVVTPEMTSLLDQDPKRLFSNLDLERSQAEIDQFSQMAQSLDIHLLVGSVAVPVEGRRAGNRGMLFSPIGDMIAQYDKIHMFDVSLPDGETWRESALYKPGESAVLAQTSLGKIGLTICYDLRFPELFKMLAQAGAKMIAVPAAFTAQTGRAHWELLLRARAIENGLFIIAPAQGGKHEDGRETWGHSMIIDPWGNVLSQSGNANPGVVLADIDLSKVEMARNSIPNLSVDSNYKVMIFSE